MRYYLLFLFAFQIFAAETDLKVPEKGERLSLLAAGESNLFSYGLYSLSNFTPPTPPQCTSPGISDSFFFGFFCFIKN